MTLFVTPMRAVGEDSEVQGLRIAALRGYFTIALLLPHLNTYNFYKTIQFSSFYSGLDAVIS